MITQERLKELLHYNEETGVFTRVKLCGGEVAGASAGFNSGDGYLQIQIDGKKYKAHRLAWLFVNGEIPPCAIDHINCNRSDNRIANLRADYFRMNLQNSIKPYSTNKSGYLGVYFVAQRDKWRASLHVNGKSTCVGYFKTPEEAHSAYVDAKRIHHKFCTL